MALLLGGTGWAESVHGCTDTMNGSTDMIERSRNILGSTCLSGVSSSMVLMSVCGRTAQAHARQVYSAPRLCSGSGCAAKMRTSSSCGRSAHRPLVSCRAGLAPATGGVVDIQACCVGLGSRQTIDQCLQVSSDSRCATMVCDHMHPAFCDAYMYRT